MDLTELEPELRRQAAEQQDARKPEFAEWEPAKPVNLDLEHSQVAETFVPPLSPRSKITIAPSSPPRMTGLIGVVEHFSQSAHSPNTTPKGPPANCRNFQEFVLKGGDML